MKTAMSTESTCERASGSLVAARKLRFTPVTRRASAVCSDGAL
jgi:hypothetical protein